MIRVRFLFYMLLSFVLGMGVIYLTWTLAYRQGMVIGRAEYVAWIHDFDVAMKEKSPLYVTVYGEEYKLLPHTINKEVLVVKISKKKSNRVKAATN